MKPTNIVIPSSTILDEEILKLVSVPHPVFLYHSTWGTASLYPGKIRLSKSDHYTLLWSSVRSPEKLILNLKLLRSGNFISGPDAFHHLKSFMNPSKSMSPELVMVLAYSDSLCIVFDDAKIYQVWTKALHKIMKSLLMESFLSESGERSSRYAPDQYGAVFDISEPGDKDQIWKEIKVTFVKENASQAEYFTYDRSQENLYDSVNEILDSVERYVDVVNVQILKMYLNDVTRLEKVGRVWALPGLEKIKKLVNGSLKYKRSENAVLREEYQKINGAELGALLIEMIKKYEQQDYGDSLADAMGLVFMQKISDAISMHQVACEHTIAVMGKSLVLARAEKPSIMAKPDQEEKRTNESYRTDIESRISSIFNKREESEVKKSLLRDNCDCLTF